MRSGSIKIKIRIRILTKLHGSVTLSQQAHANYAKAPDHVTFPILFCDKHGFKLKCSVNQTKFVYPFSGRVCRFIPVLMF